MNKFLKRISLVGLLLSTSCGYSQTGLPGVGLSAGINEYGSGSILLSAQDCSNNYTVGLLPKYYTLNKNVFSRVDIPQENEERKLFVNRADLEKLRNEEGERKIDRYIDEGPDAANYKLTLTIWGLIALAGVGIIIVRMFVG